MLEVAEPSAPDGGRGRRAGARGRARTSSGGAPQRRRAVADVGLVGAAEVGDEVIVNVQALDLGLGSGGFDVVHANLTRGLSGEGEQLVARRRDEAQLHEPAARGGAGRRRGAGASRGAARGGARPARPARRAGLGLLQPGAGAAAGIRPDRGRRASGRALAHRPRAAPAGAAGRAHHRGRRLRRRGRGDQHGGRAAPRPAEAGLGRGGVRSRAGDRGLRLGARARRHGGAGLGPRVARAGLPDAAGRAHVLQRRARAPPRHLPPHPHGPRPAAGAGHGGPAGRHALAGRDRAGGQAGGRVRRLRRIRGRRSPWTSSAR